MTDDVRGMFCQHYGLTSDSVSKPAPSPFVVSVILHFVGVSPLLNDPLNWFHDLIPLVTGLSSNSVRC